MNETSKNLSLVNASAPNATLVNPYYSIISEMSRYMYPIISLVGLVGNTLAFTTFAASKLRKMSCSFYLAARAVTDSWNLLVVFLMWTEAYVKRVLTSDALCVLIVFASYVGSSLSVWFVVAITSENYVRICHPFRVARFCSVEKAKRIILVMFILSCFIYSFSFWTTEYDQKNGCHQIRRFEFVLNIIMQADTFVTVLLPTAIMLFMIARIIYNSCMLSRSQVSSAKQAKGASKGGEHKSRSKMQTKTTRLLLTVSLVFLFLNTPLTAFRFRAFIELLITRKEYKDSLTGEEMLLSYVFQLLYYINISINFEVYLICGKTFRQEFSNKFCFFLPRSSHNNNRDLSLLTTDRLLTEQDTKSEALFLNKLN